ncbi:DUF6090 family protein [Sabulilitoribacter multivorans]|uniref:DUF6090 family protein n=1 Tax=Flaviramulus multivorans TaxID=1304750 RepID=A0ABS9IJZ9_9FLAO|nr:DUF6090 family protein [Flaviramulus multivorans]MCF7560919.1 DUF6090 family protein [Flaviramulus multivorans]
MIKFFRKIREKLLSENKFSKYFIYAIGEIILVVIGILIALQVNNVNEQQKSNDFEVKILKELRSNLKVDLLEIRDDLGLMVDINKACLDVKKHLEHFNEPTDSFNISTSLLRVTPHFSPINSGYDLLLSRGVGIIRNDSLRKDISFHYDMLYPYYKTYEEERTRFHALHSEPKLLEYFFMNFDKNHEINFHGFYFNINNEDYQTLKGDSKFSKLLSAIAFENKAIQNRGLRIESSILTLINKIETELENLE